jgi:uroporphyrinogen-III synthase
VRRVLVTRPEPGASRTAGRLAALGFEPVLLPLTKIVPLPVETWSGAENIAALAITSANAVRHTPPPLLRDLAGLPAFAVGERTAQVAAEAGVSVKDAGAGDADRLAERIVASVQPGSKILLLCGRIRRGTLESRLAAAGLPVRAIETYDTVPVSLSGDELSTEIGDRSIDAVLVYSAVAATILSPFVSSFLTAAFIAISDRVAQNLPAGLGNRIHIAREPTEDAMLSLLPKV